MHFLEWKCIIFDADFTELCSWVSNWHIYIESGPRLLWIYLYSVEQTVDYPVKLDVFLLMRHCWDMILGQFHLKILSLQYRKSHCGDKTILWSSYFHSGIYFTCKVISLYWISNTLCCSVQFSVPLVEYLWYTGRELRSGVKCIVVTIVTGSLWLVRRYRWGQVNLKTISTIPSH